MALPTIHINITANMVAAYAAIVSTVTASVQLANYLRDRARVKVEVLFNRVIVGDPRYRDRKLIQVTVTNIGRRPITVTGINVTRLYPCPTHYVLTDIQPPAPKQLTEGEYVMAFVPQADMVLSEIRSWNASTSIGRTFSCHQAPWYKRKLSDRQWKKHLAEEADKKSAAQ